MLDDNQTLLETRPSLDQVYLRVVMVIAERSTCVRRSVGCVLVDERGRVLATGYNGVARGAPHCNAVKLRAGMKTYPHACSGAWSPSGTNLDACSAVHAEQNALIQCRDVDKIMTCYVTVPPCMSCTKLLLATSCVKLVYARPYPGSDVPLSLWADRGRQALYLPLEK